MASKTRRPPPPMTPKGVATPRRKAPTSKAVNKAALENFDIEVEDRLTKMRADLDSMYTQFMRGIDVSLFPVPADMRGMTLGDLERSWAGSIAATARAISKQKFTLAHPARDEAEVVAAAKRKRAQSPGTPVRSTKNPRSVKPAGTPASGAAKRRAVTTKRAKLIVSAPSGTSMLPQDHVFNPHLPKTPKLPRAPRRNESFFSANGSPVALDEGSDGNDEDEDEEEDDGAASDASDASDELPDPEEMERRALGRTGSQKSTKSVKSTTSTKSTKSVASGTSKSSRSTRKVKRAPSLLFRQAASGAEDDDDEADISSSPDGTARIALSDGREIEFDPINIDAARIDAELEEGGLDEDEKHRVKARVQEEAMRTLAARMAAWKALK